MTGPSVTGPSVNGQAAAGPAALPVLARTKAELAAARAGLHTGPVVFVPTMGALHSAHGTLLRAAGALAGPDG
ncbi:MAG TPA: pantoate--beta-alanine ligase, partial [Streptosporangiaceae bacterium]|nr:pantoate--beta-alanine ligase [Streptosporangiaceae bacterium]